MACGNPFFHAGSGFRCWCGHRNAFGFAGSPATTRVHACERTSRGSHGCAAVSMTLYLLGGVECLTQPHGLTSTYACSAGLCSCTCTQCMVCLRQGTRLLPRLCRCARQVLQGVVLTVWLSGLMDDACGRLARLDSMCCGVACSCCSHVSCSRVRPSHNTYSLAAATSRKQHARCRLVNSDRGTRHLPHSPTGTGRPVPHQSLHNSRAHTQPSKPNRAAPAYQQSRDTRALHVRRSRRTQQHHPDPNAVQSPTPPIDKQTLSHTQRAQHTQAPQALGVVRHHCPGGRAGGGPPGGGMPGGAPKGGPPGKGGRICRTRDETGQHQADSHDEEHTGASGSLATCKCRSSIDYKEAAAAGLRAQPFTP